MNEGDDSKSPVKSDQGGAEDFSMRESIQGGNVAIARRGRPKRLATVRLDSDLVDKFKLDGHGWQQRINEALREWLATR